VGILADMNPTGNARRLRREQTKEEKQLWHALRAERFAGFKFRRQHPQEGFYLDFYCAAARLAVELDGFEHGLPGQRRRDLARERLLTTRDIKVLRFWNHQWRRNREGVLLEIWYALYERTGCTQVVRRLPNQRYVPPDPRQLIDKPRRPRVWYPPGIEPDRAPARQEGPGVPPGSLYQKYPPGSGRPLQERARQEIKNRDDAAPRQAAVTTS
jgi:very-short-patch-repair endonuclease